MENMPDAQAGKEARRMERTHSTTSAANKNKIRLCPRLDRRPDNAGLEPQVFYFAYWTLPLDTIRVGPGDESDSGATVSESAIVAQVVPAAEIHWSFP